MRSLIFLLGLMSICLAAGCAEEQEVFTISFDEDLGSGLEGHGNSPITIVLDKPLPSDLVVNFELSGSANPFADYIFPVNTTILAGKTTGIVNLFINDNEQYTAGEKEVIIALSSTSQSNAVKLGKTLSFAYTILENDLEIELAWNSNIGQANDYDLDLFMYKPGDDEDAYKKSDLATNKTETLLLTQKDDNAEYLIVVNLFSYIGNQPNLILEYTVTVRTPDGLAIANSRFFKKEETKSRRLFSITKEGNGKFLVSKDSLLYDDGKVFIIPPKS